MRLLSFVVALLLGITVEVGWAMPLEDVDGVLTFKDRYYSLVARRGKEFSAQYTLRGLVHAPQCSSGAINLQVAAVETPSAQITLMLWPESESVATQFCALMEYLPLKFPLVTIRGTVLESPHFSLNGKEIPPSKTTVHLLPTGLTIDKSDTR